MKSIGSQPGYRGKVRRLNNWAQVARTWQDGPNIVRLFKRLYKHPSDIDLYVGGLLEFPSFGFADGRPNSVLGSTHAYIIGSTFRRLKNSDRFFYDLQGYRASFRPIELKQIRRYSLAHLFCNNLNPQPDGSLSTSFSTLQHGGPNLKINFLPDVLKWPLQLPRRVSKSRNVKRNGFISCSKFLPGNQINYRLFRGACTKGQNSCTFDRPIQPTVASLTG